MPHTEMPAWKLTADSIWSSFRSSGKRHLLLTGSRGSGKSTLLSRLADASIPGILTCAVSAQAVYLREKNTDRETVIGLPDPFAAGPCNRMRPLVEGFTDLGIPALQRCAESDSEWVLLDEIGYLESGCSSYCDAIRKLMEKKHVIAALRKQELPFLSELIHRDDAFVIDLDALFGNTGCVIMASGLASRFGSNKLLADFHGEPLIARALAATVCIPHRVVVTRHAEVAAFCRYKGVPVVLHDLPYRNDTVRLGLEALSQADQYIFCPGDQPLLRSDTVQALAILGLQSSSHILRTKSGETLGAPILFPKQYVRELSSLPQGKGGNYLTKKYPEQVRCLPVRDRLELMDVDTPEDLAFLLEQ